MVCNLSPLSLCLSVKPEHLFLLPIHPDPMNMPKTKSNTSMLAERVSCFDHVCVPFWVWLALASGGSVTMGHGFFEPSTQKCIVITYHSTSTSRTSGFSGHRLSVIFSPLKADRRDRRAKHPGVDLGWEQILLGERVLVHE